MNCTVCTRTIFWCGALFVLTPITIGFAQKMAQPTRVWSIGPLTHGELVQGIAFGPNGATLTGPHIDSQTGSIFAATHSVVFAGDRIVVTSRTGTRMVKCSASTQSVYQLLSLDAQTGQVKDTREIVAFGSLPLFATNDAHVIAAGRALMRLAPSLNDDKEFDYHSTGHRFGDVQNISPDGSTIGNATSPGFELINAETFAATELTASPSVATSVNSKGFVTDNVHWIGDYPKDLGFVTYVDAAGQHLLYHGKCGGRPQFLSDTLILEPGCKNPIIIDTQGKTVRSLSLTGEFSYAGSSQNGKRFALQTAGFSRAHSVKSERFIIYSLETGEPITEVVPDEQPEGQSWTAFSPDGLMFVVGSPAKLTLYRLP